MRASISSTSTGAGSATLPLFSLYAVATGGCQIREVSVFNTTTTAARYQLVRLSTAGTQGAAITVNKFGGADAPTPLMKGFNTHTGGPTLGTVICTLECGAAIGAGTIRTFYGENNGLWIPVGTANGIGVVAIGTGQIVDFDIIWDE